MDCRLLPLVKPMYLTALRASGLESVYLSRAYSELAGELVRPSLDREGRGYDDKTGHAICSAKCGNPTIVKLSLHDMPFPQAG